MSDQNAPIAPSTPTAPWPEHAGDIHGHQYQSISDIALPNVDGFLRNVSNLFHHIPPSQAQFPNAMLQQGVPLGVNNPRVLDQVFSKFEEIYHSARGGIVGGP